MTERLNVPPTYFPKSFKRDVYGYPIYSYELKTFDYTPRRLK